MINDTINSSRARFLLAIAAAAITAACSDATGLEKRSRVSFSVAAPRAASASSGVIATALRIISGNGHVLDLQHADLTLSDVRLDRRDGRNGGDSDSDGRHRNDASFRSGPTTIELPLDGGIVTPLTGDVPFGTYDELEADLEFLRLRGSYDGQPFDVTIEIDRELALQLNPPLVVDANHPRENVTLNVDIVHCFRDRAGTPIDPRRLRQDSALRSEFRNCIATALRAFEDSDRDGDDADSDSDSDSD